ncbi:hypothetical protein R3W88_001025 [Solanum pinnatisectum]|uniref:F-box domain-containing protein n=1 Tax=Solanum pinnatisectum TaxID=50273 RepID=A0AAV9MHL2_9SOLN|nr:hypothetical protein R3W88_001025 [Solanum pinnatisectum]
MEEVEEKSIIELLDDVMIDILKRLPARSLIRLKCVSKRKYQLREFWELPPSILPPLAHLSPTKELAYLVDMTVGIGFDTNTNDYKVVRILDPGNEYEFEDFDNKSKHLSKVEVYYLSTNSWRKVEDLECLIDPLHCSYVLFKRAYHWRGYLKEGGNCIVTFDFNADLFQKLPYPEGIARNGRESLFVLNQTLALIHFTVNFPQEVLVDQSIDIWVMKKYGVRESWVKELIDLHMSCVPNSWEAMLCKESLISIKKERDKWS